MKRSKEHNDFLRDIYYTIINYCLLLKVVLKNIKSKQRNMG